MAAKSLKIDSLDLDLENPRIVLATDQRDAMQKIISEQKAKLINLAESIAVKGFSPIDRCLILRSHLRTGRFPPGYSVEWRKDAREVYTTSSPRYSAPQHPLR